MSSTNCSQPPTQQNIIYLQDASRHNHIKLGSILNSMFSSTSHSKAANKNNKSKWSLPQRYVLAVLGISFPQCCYKHTTTTHIIKTQHWPAPASMMDDGVYLRPLHLRLASMPQERNPTPHLIWSNPPAKNFIYHPLAQQCFTTVIYGKIQCCRHMAS